MLVAGLQDSFENVAHHVRAARTATTLRSVRAELMDEIVAERRRAARFGVTSDAIIGTAEMRARLFPHVDEIAGYVNSLAIAHDIGALLRSCVRMAIELTVTRHDNDHAGHRDASLEPVGTAYRSTLAELVARNRDSRIRAAPAAC